LPSPRLHATLEVSAIHGRRSGLFRVCAWCERFLGVNSPLSDLGLTHGICAECAERLRVEERRTRGRALVVVRRSRDRLRDSLEATYAGFEDIAVRLDQREGERRRGGLEEDRGRRHSDRRRRLAPSQVTAWGALGAFVVR